MRKTYLIVIAFLVLLNILVTITLTNTKNIIKEFQFLYFTTKDNLDSKNKQLDDIKNNIFNCLLINNNRLSEEMVLTDENNIQYSMKEIFEDGKEKLAIRVCESYCNPCIKKYLSRIKKSAEKSGSNDVIIFASVSDINSFKNEFNIYGFKIFFINETLLLEFDSNEQPYIFTIDNSLVSRNGFIPHEADLDFVENYTFNILSKINLNI